jgi:hypothetical protein
MKKKEVEKPIVIPQQWVTRPIKFSIKDPSTGKLVLIHEVEYKQPLGEA